MLCDSARLPLSAFAAEGGGEHGGGSVMEWVWRWLISAILVFILRQVRR